MSHLIIHKVRGEPAFDIAEQIGEEGAWIIPTSGHRAYPLWVLPLEEVLEDNFLKSLRDMDFSAHPDHYAANPSPKDPSILAGIVKAFTSILPPMKRRS